MTSPHFSPQIAVNGPPRPNTTQQHTFPAQIGGINAMDGLADMPERDCLYAFNIMPSEYGMRTRKGNVEHANGFVGTEIRTLIPYAGNAEEGTDDRLFALDDTGIYDITDAGVADPKIFTWAVPSGVAGFAVYTHYTNDAGAHFLMCADELNGLHEYEEATDTWTLTVGITGPTISNVAHVMAHKKRLWLVENDAGEAWYLPTGAKAGAATKFNFGSQFREGGSLVGLWSWTVDGGDGVNDYLVAISKAGGVAIYSGSDPANPSTWGIVGVWYIGKVPAGHRIASEYGGELMLLSEGGIVSVNELIKGASVEDATQSVSGKMTRLVRQRMGDTIDIRGWEIRISTAENALVVVAPPAGADIPTQFVRNLSIRGWGFWRDMDMLTGDVWRGEFYWADRDGSVWRHSGEVDSVLLDGTPGIEIDFSMMSTYSPLGAPSVYKRVQNIRPHFLSVGLPSFSTRAIYDYAISEFLANPVFEQVNVASWDVALWDLAVWAGGLEPTQSVRGGSGMGVAVAVATRGSTAFRLDLIATDVVWDQGGFF